jgi:adenosylcobyric acid synthase
VRTDLSFLRHEGWPQRLNRHLRYGGRLLGICGGYQMLGTLIRDPQGLESTPGDSPGLGLLNLQTTLEPEKQLLNVTARLTLEDIPVSGYEIHAGVTTGADLNRPFLIKASGEPDGAFSQDCQVAGTYLHGLFESAEGSRVILGWAGLSQAKTLDYHKLREREIDRLADLVEEYLDTGFILDLLGI